MNLRSAKALLLAATAGAALCAAPAAGASTAPTATFVAQSHVIDHEATADIEAPAPTSVKMGLLGALVAAIIAGGALLLPRRWRAAAREAVGKAAPIMASAVRAAMAAPARLIGRPLRAFLILAAVALFALTGVSFLDMEWTAGVLTGLATALCALFLAGRLGFSLRRAG